MTRRWQATFGAVLAVLGLSGGAQAGDDPFQKALQGRLSHEMNVAALAAENGGRVPGMRAAGRLGSRPAPTVTAVFELESAAAREAVTARVQAEGGRVVAAVDHLLKAELPKGALRAVAETPGVVHVRAPFKPSRKNSVISEGVATTRAREFTARTGANGAGVAVAVLDSGFARAADLVGGELPADLLGTDFVLSRIGSYENVHGTACAEIVHDMAPGARIVLAGFEDDVTWAQAVDEIVAARIPIISHSIGFDNLFPPDGNNYYTQKVDQAAGAGVLFVTAAGNEGGKYYSGGWRDLNGNEFLEFGPQGAEMLPIGAGPGTRVVLRWDDPFGQSRHDYDLLIVTEGFASDPRVSADNPHIVAASADLQSGAGTPREIVDFEVPEATVLYVVVWHDPASPRNSAQRFWIWASDDVAPQFAVAAGSLTMPGDARGALTVGAVHHATGLVEGFSSRGPTQDGRVKPDIAAPDAVTTVSYDGAPFFGTSAATPHVAGAAALLLSRNPSLSGPALRLALEQATASGGRSRNNDVGTGILNLDLAR